MTQNQRLLDYLLQGKMIHCMHPDVSELGIGYLNSRISDLRNQNDIPIESRYDTVYNRWGEPVTCKIYWIRPDMISQLKSKQTV